MLKTILLFILLFTSTVYANDTALIDAADNGDIKEVQALIKKGVDVNAYPTNGYSPLSVAIMSGHMEIVELLVENGADINDTDIRGVTPLIDASWGNPTVKDYRTIYVKIVKLLLLNGADPNIKDNKNTTPLMAASVVGNIDIVKLLVNAGASLDTISYGNSGTPKTALMLASEKGHEKLVKLLKEAGAIK